MNAPALKTKAEQKVEWFGSLDRRLTDAEYAELERALHAVYVRDRRSRALASHEREEAELLAKVEAEARQPDPGRWER
jgi:hypothetical protein